MIRPPQIIHEYNTITHCRQAIQKTGLKCEILIVDFRPRRGLGQAVHTPILLAGPTSSGKSALALALAQALGGVIINADSMQVYRDLRIVTARPIAQEEARVP